MNGKVVSIYLGKGPDAEAAHQAIQRKHGAKAEIKERAEAHAPVRRCFEDTDRLMDLWYFAHGFHYVNGKWRKRNARTLTPEIIAETERYHILYQRLDAALRAQRMQDQIQGCSGNETKYGVTVSCSTQNGGTAFQAVSESPRPVKPPRRPRPTARWSRRKAALIGLCTGITQATSANNQDGS